MPNWTLALAIGATATLLASVWIWLFERPRHETRNGLKALASMSWREFSGVVLAALRQRKGFELFVFNGGQIPDALLVDELVGCQRSGLAPVAQMADTTGTHRFFKPVKVLAIDAFHLGERAAKQIALLIARCLGPLRQPPQRIAGQLLLNIEQGHHGVELLELQARLQMGLELVAAIGIALYPFIQAAEVSKDGALADIELLCQGRALQLLARVESLNDGCQAFGQLLGIFRGHIVFDNFK